MLLMKLHENAQIRQKGWGSYGAVRYDRRSVNKGGGVHAAAVHPARPAAPPSRHAERRCGTEHRRKLEHTVPAAGPVQSAVRQTLLEDRRALLHLKASRLSHAQPRCFLCFGTPGFTTRHSCRRPGRTNGPDGRNRHPAASQSWSHRFQSRGRAWWADPQSRPSG